MSKDLELYKFCIDKEMRWVEGELIIWVGFENLKELTYTIGYNCLCEEGVKIIMQKDCIVLDLVPICEYFDIEPTDIFRKR